MYESYFGLRELPFNVTPNPRYFFVNTSYQEAFSTLCYGVERRAGIIVITGDAGTGKTTLLKMFLGKTASNIHASCILDPHLNFTELLLCTLDVFGLSDIAPDRLTITRELNRYLIEQLRREHFVVLFLDEAQGLDDDVFEELRLLSDLEDGGKTLLQIVLIGQPELESRLEQSSLRPLRQRVTIRARLAPLGSDDIQPYIDFRLSAAGYVGKPIFVTHAIERIDFYSKGIPRLINVICDNALLVASAKSQKIVDGETIEEVADELQLGGFYSAKLQPTLAKAARLEISEEAGRYGVVRGECETQSGECRVHNSDQIAGSGTGGPFHAANRAEIRWAALAVAIVTLIVIVGGGAFLSAPQEHQMYLSPVTDNVQKIKELFAPIPGRIYRAVIVYAEGRQDPETVVQAKKDAPKQTKSARDSFLIEPKRNPKNIERATVPEFNQRPPRKHQSVESKKPSVPRTEFTVVGNSFVRNKPSSDAEIIATLHPGTGIQLVRRIGDYLQIRSTENGAVRGYVHREDAFFERSDNRAPPEY